MKLRNALSVPAKHRRNAGAMTHSNPTRQASKDAAINEQLENMMAKYDDNVIICDDCVEEMELSVCQSAAGFYLGFWCNTCGPYDRVSDYFGTREEADAALTEAKKTRSHKSYWED